MEYHESANLSTKLRASCKVLLYKKNENFKLLQILYYVFLFKIQKCLAKWWDILTQLGSMYVYMIRYFNLFCIQKICLLNCHSCNLDSTVSDSEECRFHSSHLMLPWLWWWEGQRITNINSSVHRLFIKCVCVKIYVLNYILDAIDVYWKLNGW